MHVHPSLVVRWCFFHLSRFSHQRRDQKSTDGSQKDLFTTQTLCMCLLTCQHLCNEWMSEMVTLCGTESVHLLLVTCLINNATLTVFTQQALSLQYASLALLFASGYFIFYLTLYYLSSQCVDKTHIYPRVQANCLESTAIYHYQLVLLACSFFISVCILKKYIFPFLSFDFFFLFIK